MKFKHQLIILTLFIGLSTIAQTGHNILKDSTKIKIIGDSIYRVHLEKYNYIDSNLLQTDSTRIKYKNILLSNVLFRKSKSEILPESIDDLNEVLILLKDNPKIKLEIKGFTDMVGNRKSNQDLSLIRARMVKIYLSQNSVNSNRMITYGFGDRHPICKSPCKKNQRVEFIMTEI